MTLWDLYTNPESLKLAVKPLIEFHVKDSVYSLQCSWVNRNHALHRRAKHLSNTVLNKNQQHPMNRMNDKTAVARSKAMKKLVVRTFELVCPTC